MMLNRSLPRKVKFKTPKPNYADCADIVEYKLVQKVKKTGEGDEDFIVVDELVEVSRVNRQATYNKIAKDHDLYQIIKKVAETGDESLLNQGPAGVYLDVSKLPENNAELNAKLANAAKVWESLPEDLKQKMSLGTFVDTMTDEKVAQYVQKKAAEKKAAEKIEEAK